MIHFDKSGKKTSEFKRFSNIGPKNSQRYKQVQKIDQKDKNSKGILIKDGQVSIFGDIKEIRLDYSPNIKLEQALDASKTFSPPDPMDPIGLTINGIGLDDSPDNHPLLYPPYEGGLGMPGGTPETLMNESMAGQNEYMNLTS